MFRPTWVLSGGGSAAESPPGKAAVAGGSQHRSLSPNHPPSLGVPCLCVVCCLG